jgi:murein DD-endopeptidase MepM/ murein hydrolase activator NlpD
MARALSPAARHTLRAFGAGAGCGFLIGAFLIAAVVWRYGNVIGSHAASREYPPEARSALERWTGGIDDAGDAVIRGKPADAADGPTGTSGAAVAVPAPSPEPTIGAPPAEELADRDLIVPVEGVKPEQLTRSFADERSGSRQHEAIDILAPLGTPVLAVESGKIARLFLSKAGGITVYQFDQGERFSYYYAHLDRYAPGLQEGQTVRQGQVIGFVGVSGNAPKNTPHLHFAIFRLSAEKRWWEGTPVDPYDVLK